MKKDKVLIKENGKIINNSDEVNSEIFKQEHLCDTCKFSNPTDCEKVRHIFANGIEDFKGSSFKVKQPISEYSEITDGWQLIDENDIIQKFIVTGCKKYEFINKNKEPKVSIKEMKRIRESLYAFYTDYQRNEEGPIKKRKLKGGNPNIDSYFQF